MDVVAPGVRRIALRTPTLPPATHTNCYVLGEGQLTLVDPASPWEDEQSRLWQAVLALRERGEDVQRIFLTHHHHDHVSGAENVQERLAQIGVHVDVVAHPVTRDLLDGALAVQATLEHDEVLDCGGHAFVAMHTPGHAPGHLVLHDRDGGAMVAGDMVAGVGTILIDPSEGDLGHYLASLEAMRVAEPDVLLPAHGPEMVAADAVLGFYVAHRHQRTQQIGDALRAHGTQSAMGLAPHVYPELDAAMHPIAAVQITAHLNWMIAHGLATEHNGSYTAQ